MRIVEFRSRFSEQHVIKVPAEIAEEIPVGSALRIMVAWGESDDPDWLRVASERLADAYAPEDSVSEQRRPERPPQAKGLPH